MWYLYLIRCSDDSLYAGITKDYRRRFHEHKSGKGSKYCKIKGVKALVALWEIGESKSLASSAEYYLKKKMKKEKENLVKNRENFQIILKKKKSKEDLAEEIFTFRFLGEDLKNVL